MQKGKRMKILIVEDDMKTAGFVEKAFQQAGFVTCHVTDGENALAKATTEDFDVAVVDLMLPKLDGLSVIEGIRNAGRKFPIIVLSAKGSVESKIKGLETGGDDYMSKPFSITELLARVQALLRRSSSTPDSMILTVEDLTLDIV